MRDPREWKLRAPRVLGVEEDVWVPDREDPGRVVERGRGRIAVGGGAVWRRFRCLEPCPTCGADVEWLPWVACRWMTELAGLLPLRDGGRFQACARCASAAFRRATLGLLRGALG